MITPAPYLWLIPILPLLGAAINGLGGYFLMQRFGPKANHAIAIAMPTGSFLLTLLACRDLGFGHEPHALYQFLFPFLHIGLFDANMAFWFDPLSATLTLIITFVGTLIHVYSIGYMHGDPGYWRFFTYLNLFMAAMLMLVLGDNFMVMFIGWEGVGLCSYLLISFWYKEKANAVAGMKAFVVNRIGDFAFVLGLAFLFWGMMGDFTQAAPGFHNTQYRGGFYGRGGAPVAEVERRVLERQAKEDRFETESPTPPPASVRFNVMREIIARDEGRWREDSPGTKRLLGIPLIVVVCLLLFIAATGKSAQLPLYVWLPDAMAGPTPVSALIHAATMVTAGVYMVARLSFLFALSSTAMTVVAVVGCLTALFAATIGLFQYDIKKVLAYSTVSQLGYMFMGVGGGAYWAGVYHLLTHALFKACLFLGSGSVILGCHHEQDMRKMGGLREHMPLTRWTYWIACVSITTAPFFFLANGFFSKDEILWKVFDAEHLLVPGPLLWMAGALGAVCTSFYMWRSYYMTFTGTYRGDPHHHPHESPRSMTFVLCTLAGLAVASIALGFWPLLHIEPLFEQWLHPVVGEVQGLIRWRSATDGATFAGLGISTWEYLLAGASVLLTMGGFLTARWLYKDATNPLPHKLLQSPSPWVQRPYRLIYNKYFVDEAYDAAVVSPTRKLAVLLFRFDQKVLDGLVNFVGFLGKMIGFLDGLFDSLIVDGLVNGVASAFRAAGRAVRRTQTGRIQTYLAGALGGVIMLVLASFILF
jgi:NADH-quinone oxidoreductase subunit L